jgi:anti-sigma regulatory factor (Ser/Thr protein kinase)
MSTATTTRPPQLQARPLRMAAAPAAAAEARRHVRTAIRAWQVPVDLDTAVLLTSELVANAVTAAPAGDVTLCVRCARGQLRVEVHDTAPSLPVPAAASASAEAGRGLMLVAALSASWGCYRTPAGKAVYFTLAFQPGP